ncbi:hypothetical protein HELRODRAFT_162668 [Helobdella robusta]|uniref:Uncharacterized protein n=1 Tax=Helobdella robusta TaxID=6412 RepID=T1ESZ8_HELRO|nr:hypothetical protein HELRODRAFT_162668 [Helobdella robusta]ESN99173.1 hypothetical protein HELRODRAFT_162668 [Helobdella robusta]
MQYDKSDLLFVLDTVFGRRIFSVMGPAVRNGLSRDLRDPALFMLFSLADSGQASIFYRSDVISALLRLNENKVLFKLPPNTQLTFPLYLSCRINCSFDIQLDNDDVSVITKSSTATTTTSSSQHSHSLCTNTTSASLVAPAEELHASTSSAVQASTAPATISAAPATSVADLASEMPADDQILPTLPREAPVEFVTTEDIFKWSYHDGAEKTIAIASTEIGHHCDAEKSNEYAEMDERDDADGDHKDSDQQNKEQSTNKIGKENGSLNRHVTKPHLFKTASSF